MVSALTQLDHIAGNTIIQFTETDPALLNVDAVVEEQDTNLILGKSPVILETIENFPTLVKKMEQQTQEIVGNVLVKQSIPIRFIAIVYDVEHTPSARKYGSKMQSKTFWHNVINTGSKHWPCHYWARAMEN
jgi:hypothetical protein